MRGLVIAAVAATTVLAASAQAQLTLAFDINGFNYEFKDSGGATAFGGDTHTGTVEWDYNASPATTIADTRVGLGGQFGSFSSVALGAYTLADFEGDVTFLNGAVQSGDFTVTLSNGDTYTAQLKSGGLTSVGSQYTLDGMTFEGAFSDDSFGDIDVTEWYDRQGNPGELFGSIFKFRFQAAATGNGDMEVFVMVPLPAAAWAGLGMLAGVMGLTWRLRRG